VKLPGAKWQFFNFGAIIALAMHQAEAVKFNPTGICRPMSREIGNDCAFAGWNTMRSLSGECFPKSTTERDRNSEDFPRLNGACGRISIDYHARDSKAERDSRTGNVEYGIGPLSRGKLLGVSIALSRYLRKTSPDQRIQLYYQPAKGAVVANPRGDHWPTSSRRIEFHRFR